MDNVWKDVQMLMHFIMVIQCVFHNVINNNLL